MKLFAISNLLGMLAAWPGMAQAELRVVPDSEPSRIFAGMARDLRVVWQNTGEQSVTMEVQMRLVQTASRIATPIGESPWKRLSILPGQTLIERASLDLPDVRAETRFLVQWFANTNQVLGNTDVLVYPTNLLQDLLPLAGGEPLGVLDPQNELKPLLKWLAVEFEDLEAGAVNSFSGKLAIVGPYPSRKFMPEGLADRIAVLARKGGAVVLILPPSECERKLKPTFYSVPLGEGMVIVAQARLVANLATDPAAQLNLIQLAEYAVRRESLRLPSSSP